MTLTLEELAALALALPSSSRKHLAQLLAQSALPDEVRDSGSSYGEFEPDPKGVLGKELIDMKSVTVVLPDDLAKQAQAAGLLTEKRFEELIREALQEQGSGAASKWSTTGQRRRLVRHHGHLVVEALPREQAITDAEVRDLLNKMEW